MFELSRLDFRRTPVTMLLLAAIAALEIVCSLDESRRKILYETYGLGISPQIWAGDLWQPLTTTLLHGNLIHALFNGLMLALFGEALETRFGSLRFAAFYVLLAYVTSLANFVGVNYFATDGWVGLVGASGVAYGLFAFIWVGSRFEPSWRAYCPPSTVQVMLFWFVLCIVLTSAGVMRIGNVAHGAGIFFGALYALAYYDRRQRWLWIAAAAASTGVVLTTLFWCPGLPLYAAFRAFQAGNI